MSRRSSTDQAVENGAIAIIGILIFLPIAIIIGLVFFIVKLFEKSPEEQLRSMGEVPVWGAKIVGLPCPICYEDNEADAVICYQCGTNMVEVRQSLKWIISQKMASFKAQLNEYGQQPSKLVEGGIVAEYEYVILVISIVTILSIVLILMFFSLIF